ncbi:MAG: hypothetical protein AAGA68_27215, partial [Pseudomonadota bacterium]
PIGEGGANRRDQWRSGTRRSARGKRVAAGGRALALGSGKQAPKPANLATSGKAALDRRCPLDAFERVGFLQLITEQV